MKTLYTYIKKTRTVIKTLVLMKNKTMTPMLITQIEKNLSDPISIVNTFNEFFTAMAEIAPSKNQIFK